MVGFPQQTHGIFLLKMISTWGVKWGYHHLFWKHPAVKSQEKWGLDFLIVGHPLFKVTFKTSYKYTVYGPMDFGDSTGTNLGPVETNQPMQRKNKPIRPNFPLFSTVQPPKMPSLGFIKRSYTFPPWKSETNSPVKSTLKWMDQWLEDFFRFLLGSKRPIFRCKLTVSFREW